MEAGDVVWSRAGRDKGSFFVVVRADKRCCWVADGELRKLEAPKKKNRIHLSATKKKLNLAQIANDCQLAKALKTINQK